MRVGLDELLYWTSCSICCFAHVPIGRNRATAENSPREGWRRAVRATLPALAHEVPLAKRRLKSMPRSALQAVSRAPPGQNWKAGNQLLPPAGQQLEKSRSPVDRGGSF
jgi:hypothetical protein